MLGAAAGGERVRHVGRHDRDARHRKAGGHAQPLHDGVELGRLGLAHDPRSGRPKRDLVARFGAYDRQLAVLELRALELIHPVCGRRLDCRRGISLPGHDSGRAEEGGEEVTIGIGQVCG